MAQPNHTAEWVLECLAGKHQGDSWLLIGPRVRLGRSNDCEVVLQQEIGVSRIHAEILLSSDSAVIRDLGSQNGTLVNGIRIKNETLLNHGDLIRLGEMQLILKTYVRPENNSADTPGKDAAGNNASLTLGSKSDDKSRQLTNTEKSTIIITNQQTNPVAVEENRPVDFPAELGGSAEIIKSGRRGLLLLLLVIIVILSGLYILDRIGSQPKTRRPQIPVRTLGVREVIVESVPAFEEIQIVTPQLGADYIPAKIDAKRYSGMLGNTIVEWNNRNRELGYSINEFIVIQAVSPSNLSRSEVTLILRDKNKTAVYRLDLVITGRLERQSSITSPPEIAIADALLAETEARRQDQDELYYSAWLSWEKASRLYRHADDLTGMDRTALAAAESKRKLNQQIKDYYERAMTMAFPPRLGGRRNLAGAWTQLENAKRLLPMTPGLSTTAETDDGRQTRIILDLWQARIMRMMGA